jgi:hypothetical protein
MFASMNKGDTNMSSGTTVGAWVGIFAFMAIVLGGLDYAGRTDPSVPHESAYGAVHGIVIPPFRD